MKAELEELKLNHTKCRDVTITKKDGSKDDDVLMDHKCNEVLKNSWIVDFACYFHINLKKECFDTYKEYDEDSIALVNDNKI